MPKGTIHLVMGTHGVAVVRELEARHRAAGQTLVAAPVLGRPDLAATGQLGIVAGGPAEAVARCNELLQSMGRRIFQAGAKPESATAIKLANNAVLGCAMVAMAEGFALVRKYDVAPQVFQDVMTEGLFAATAYKVYGQKMVDESFDQVGSPIHVGLKDANLIAAAADIARVPMPSHNVYRDRLLGAVAHGDGDRDQAVLGREQARAVRARIERRAQRRAFRVPRLTNDVCQRLELGLSRRVKSSASCSKVRTMPFCSVARPFAVLVRAPSGRRCGSRRNGPTPDSGAPRRCARSSAPSLPRPRRAPRWTPARDERRR